MSTFRPAATLTTFRATAETQGDHLDTELAALDAFDILGEEVFEDSPSPHTAGHPMGRKLPVDTEAVNIEEAEAPRPSMRP